MQLGKDDEQGAMRKRMANELAKLAGFEPAPKIQASGFAGGR
jgi:hypothetical protein